MSAEPKQNEKEPVKSQAGSSTLRLVSVLTVVCAVAGAALAGGHMLTHKRIERQRYLFKLASVKKVLPSCENDPGKDQAVVELWDKSKVTVYRCRSKGRVTAVAFSLDSRRNKSMPYSGTLEVLVGVDLEKRSVIDLGKPDRVGVLVLKHSETPGLGAKIEEAAFLKQFAGRNAAEPGRSCASPKSCRSWAVIKDDANGFVDAISGATISSRAVTEIIHRAMSLVGDPKTRDLMIGRTSIPRPPASSKPEGARP